MIGGFDQGKYFQKATPDEVRAEVRHCIDALASDRTGYILAPCHNIQSVSPPENIIAMYETGYEYGWQ